MLPPVLAAAFLIFVLFPVWYWVQVKYLMPSRSRVYRIIEDRWQALPDLPGDAMSLRISPSGKVWALIWHWRVGSEIARLDAANWRVYGVADFPVEHPYIWSFALDGEEVWAAEYRGVLRTYSGGWKIYREFPSATAASIFPIHGQVWLLDVQGRLVHFDGARWTTRKTELPAASNDDRYPPEIAATDDGSLWLARDTLWRWDGNAWAPVRPGGEDLHGLRLVGGTGKQIWVGNPDFVESLSPDGRVRKFPRKNMGMRPGEAIYNPVETPDGRIAVATTRGIVEFNGVSWRRLPSPPDGLRAVLSVQAGPAGELYATGNIRNPLYYRWRRVIRPAPAVFAGLLLLNVVWIIRTGKRKRLEAYQHMREALTHATGATSDEIVRDERLLARQSSWWSAGMTVGVIAGAAAGYEVLHKFWPRAPSWTFLVIALGLHVLTTLADTLIRRTPKPWDPIEPGGPQFDWGPTKRALPASLGVFLLLNITSFPKWMGDPGAWILGGWVLFGAYRFGGQYWIAKALRRGDYAGGLERIRLVYFHNPLGAEAQWRRGSVLTLMGRYREAEEALRSAVARPRARDIQAHALEALGDALLEQSRYEEAMRSYEAAVQALPGFRRPYRGMAEVVLRQRQNPAQAMEYIEKIVTPGRRSLKDRGINSNPKDDYWALKAWALAEMGRSAEVDQAVAEAIRHTNPKTLVDVAVTYRRLGLAMRILERQSEARDYLQKALAANPHGQWSRALEDALARHTMKVS